MTVYVTGRTVRDSDHFLGGTVQGTADAIMQSGGKGIAVLGDHEQPKQIQALIAQEPFWKRSVELLKILDVGLKSAYDACYHAAPLMVKQNKGLISFSSSFGSACYMLGPAYGAQKVGVDKFAADMAVDFEDNGVCCVSMRIGPLLTERSMKAFKERPDQYAPFLEAVETAHLILRRP